MSILEGYRKTYLEIEERQKRHHFEWTVKKTESSEEESLFPPLIGLYLSGSHHVHQAATKDLVEGIEMWLKPPITPDVKKRWWSTRPEEFWL